MDICKNCLEPIPESQIYCSMKCWQEHRNPSSQVSEGPSPPLNISEWIKAQAKAWGSIIGMFFSLFILLLVIATFIEDFQLYLISSTIILSIFVFLVLRYVYDSNEITKLLKFPTTIDTWKLIGIALVIDIFVVKPLHVAISFHFFPDLQEQEVITALEEMSQISAIITAFSVSILTPILEELLFRGFILGMFLKCYNEKVAILLSAIIFAIVHEPVAIVMAFGGGLIYGWLRVRTGSIVPSTLLHIFWNSFVSIIVIIY